MKTQSFFVILTHKKFPNLPNHADWGICFMIEWFIENQQIVFPDFAWQCIVLGCSKLFGAAFLGRCKDVRTTKVKKNIKKMLENLEMYPKNYTFVS